MLFAEFPQIALEFLVCQLPFTRAIWLITGGSSRQPLIVLLQITDEPTINITHLAGTSVSFADFQELEIGGIKHCLAVLCLMPLLIRFFWRVYDGKISHYRPVMVLIKQQITYSSDDMQVLMRATNRDLIIVKQQIN
jgi:hypothetical protein